MRFRLDTWLWAVRRSPPINLSYCAERALSHRGRARVTTEQELREKLRKIAALFEGATTEGERDAAAAALNRVRAALSATEKLNQAWNLTSACPIVGTVVFSSRYAVAMDYVHIVIRDSGIRPWSFEHPNRS